jgi:hypothetical protein
MRAGELAVGEFWKNSNAAAAKTCGKSRNLLHASSSPTGAFFYADLYLCPNGDGGTFL